MLMPAALDMVRVPLRRSNGGTFTEEFVMTDRSVTDEQLGKLSRKQFEVYRRVREGTLDVKWLLEALQDLIENGRALAAEKALADLKQKISEINADLQIKKSYKHLFTLPRSPDDKPALLTHLSEVDARWTDSMASAWSLANSLERYSRGIAHLCNQIGTQPKPDRLIEEEKLRWFCAQSIWVSATAFKLWEWLRL
jgi:hypothetical protein